MRESLFSITNTTRYKKPKINFLLIKNEVLGKKYKLSLVFATSNLSKKLNKDYRNKNYSTNVLSFSLSKTSGEIFLDLKTIKAEEKKFGRKFSNLVAFLFIHGLFHLKGYSHSVTMDIKEAAVRRKMGV